MQRAASSALFSLRELKHVIKHSGSNRRILDASWHLPSSGRNALLEYQKSHIPEAMFFDIDECADKSTNLPHMIPSPKIFEDYAGALGVSNDTHVLIYDNHQQFPLFSAQRVWWMFRLFGHTKVSVLEGGLPKWILEGGTVTDKLSSCKPEKFKANFNRNLIKYFEDIKKNIEKPEFILVDARAEERFKGTSLEPRGDTKPGSILNSVNLPFTKLMNQETRTMKSEAELKHLFQEAGVDLNKNVAATCGSGVTACLIALAGHICGKDDIAVYDGSWTEWYAKAPPSLKANVPS